MQSSLINTPKYSDNFDALLNTTLALIFVLTPDGRIVKFNRACEIMTGLSFEEVKNRPYWELFLLPDDASAAEVAFKASNIGYFLNQRDGCWLSRICGYRFVEWSNTAVVDDEGVVQFLVGTGIDMTEKKEAQRRSLEMEIQQARAHELTRFFRDISHDIRTPLTILDMTAYLIDRQNQQPQLLREIETVKRETRYLMRLIHDTQLMIDLIESTQIQLLPINLDAMLRTLPGGFAEVIAAKQLDFHLDLQADGLYVAGDESLLYRALHNLVDNAIRYSPQQGHVTVRAVHEDALIAVEVNDTGIGIAPEDLPYLFDYFYKVDKARSARDAGCGLGLTIVKHVVRLHRGRIEVASEPGHGSTFRLILPQQPGA